MDSCEKSSNNSKSGFAYFEKDFLIPLRDNYNRFIFDRNLAYSILEKTKKALARLKHIEENALMHAENCNKFKSEIENAIIKVNNLNNQIKNNVP